MAEEDLTADTSKDIDVEAMLNKAETSNINELEHSLSLLRSTFDTSIDGILVTDPEHNVIDYNNKFILIWDCIDDNLLLKNCTLIHKLMLNKIKDPKSYKRAIKKLSKDTESKNKFIVALKNGTIIECSSQPYKFEGKTLGRIWNYHDITESALLEKQLKYQATHDLLTGLPNRFLLIDRILNAIERADRNKNSIALLFIDLDGFKLVNDSFSHLTGDKLLTQVAERLSDLVRKEDTLARLGGDEFLILIPDLEKDEYSMTVADKILTAFKEPYIISGYRISISASVGISIYPTDGETIDELLKNADLAMYQVKDHGGDGYQFYTRQLNEQRNLRIELEAELTHALDNHEFFLVYQPQLDIKNNITLTIEALLRWNHPKRGCLTPIEFIKIAEESGLIIPIGEWVLREACTQLKAWQKKGLPPFSIAINISTQQLKQQHFAKTVDNILQEFDLKSKWFEFEINESSVTSHSSVINMVKQLKDLGIKIALDDFGTGNCALNSLNLLKIDRLKIDPVFINNISHSKGDEVVIEAIIAMSHCFNIMVLAEGVESEVQMSYLKSKKIDQVQGYLFSYPLNVADIEQFLTNIASN